MPRKPRQQIVRPGYPHHLWFRGNNKRRLFSFARDYYRFLRYLRDAKQTFKVEVHGLALLPNHGHLLIAPSSRQGLSKLMQSVLQRYAAYRNANRGSSGKLFEGRFGCRPASSMRYLGVVTGYIDLNPFRAGLVDDVEATRWSTFACHAQLAHCEPQIRELWTPSPWYKALASTEPAQAIAYRCWIDECVARDRTQRVWDLLDKHSRTAPKTVDDSRAEPRRPGGTRAV